MAEEIRKSEVKEFHMKVAQSLRAEPEIMTVLSQTKDDLTRLWLTVCLMDGMSKDSVIDLTGVNISKIQSVRNEYLKKKYMQSDALYQTVEGLKEQVAEELQESKEVRMSIEQGLDEALKQQVKTQEELVASKDEMIAMLKKQNVELERRLYQMNQGKSHQGSGISPMPERIEKNVMKESGDESETSKKQGTAVSKDTIQEETEVQTIPQPKKSLKRFLAYTRENKDTKRFIQEFIKTDKMNNEQKEYLLQCLEEGLSVKEMEMFASADLPVEIMRRLRKYYEQQKDGSIK